MVRRLLGRHVRVRGEDRHLHGPRPGRDRLADLAEPDDPERPAAELDARELGSLPFAAPDRRVGGRDLAGDAVEQGEGVLGGRDRVAGRRVDDGDAGPGRRLEIDVVDADPGPPDDLQSRAGGDRLGVDLDLAADDERVVVGRGSRAALRGERPGRSSTSCWARRSATPSGAMGSATRILTPGRRLRWLAAALGRRVTSAAAAWAAPTAAPGVDRAALLERDRLEEARSRRGSPRRSPTRGARAGRSCRRACPGRPRGRRRAP